MPKIKELVVATRMMIDDDVLDDWQVTADALVDNTHNHQHFVPKEPPVAPVPCVEPAHAATRPEPIKTQRELLKNFQAPVLICHVFP